MLLLHFLSLFTMTATATTNSNSMPANYHLRRYQPADKDDCLSIFTESLLVEWGELHHDGKYKENAQRYVDSVVKDETSDFHNIEQVYFAKGGHFWVLVHNPETQDCEEVVGMCGLEVTSSNQVELRRMMVRKGHQGQGIGSNIMLPAIFQMAKTIHNGTMKKVFCSTPEHGPDSANVRFYKRNGFDYMLNEDGSKKIDPNIHNTPIHEAFLEYSL